MGLAFTVEHRGHYSVVRLEGEPALAEFLAFVERIGAESPAWPTRRALFDLRSVRSLTRAEEHQAVGAAVVEHLAHMERIASVVPADRVTRESERTARTAGVNLAVFTAEGEAITWLTAADP